MWDQEPDFLGPLEESDILEALEEHNFECESTDGVSDFEFDSYTVGAEEDTFDKE
jgi:hypothetical protein